MKGLITKAFEIRDRGTFIPVIATQLVSDDPAEAYLLRRTGYNLLADAASVIVTRLNECVSGNEPNGWSGRTLFQAHTYIESHFEELETGAVIDVEYILGESTEPKVSERLEGLL